MTHPIWPFFDLVVRTPRLELRYIDDELSMQLALLAQQGVHDPAFMPFSIPWTDMPSPQRERGSMQFHWRCRAELSPTSWAVNFATIVDGVVAGTTGLIASEFPTLRQFETGSWLGLAFQGKGIGKEMRVASLQLGFAGFGARWATTAAWDDNEPSLGVTNSLGYAQQGHRRSVRRGEEGSLLGFEMSRDHWEANLRRDDIEIIGVEPCLPLLGLADDPAEKNDPAQ